MRKVLVGALAVMLCTVSAQAAMDLTIESQGPASVAGYVKYTIACHSNNADDILTINDVSVEGVLKIMKTNVHNARKVIEKVAGDAPEERSCACSTSLEYAIITDRKLIPAKTRERMSPIFGRVL